LEQGELRAADLRAAGEEVLNLGAPDAAVLAKGTESFNREARVLDAHLGKQPYLVGKEPTLAEFSVAAPLFYAKEAELPLAPYAHIRNWFERVSALPAWRETAPPRLRLPHDLTTADGRRKGNFPSSVARYLVGTGFSPR
jgi:glutathione S-transferase